MILVISKKTGCIIMKEITTNAGLVEMLRMEYNGSDRVRVRTSAGRKARIVQRISYPIYRKMGGGIKTYRHSDTGIVLNFL
jgi:hypothetical protein